MGESRVQEAVRVEVDEADSGSLPLSRETDGSPWVEVAALKVIEGWRLVQSPRKAQPGR